MDERRRAAKLLREITIKLVDSDADDVEFKRIGDALEPVAEQLREHGSREINRRLFTTKDGKTEIIRDHAMMSFNPTWGPCNPISPPLDCSLTNEHAYAEVTYDRRFEGHGGYLHGGFVTCHFDEILGHATSFRKETVVTGTLNVKFRKPVPLYRRLRYEGWIERTSGRKVFAKATLKDGDTLLCEAEAIYLRMNAERFEESFKS